MSKHRDNATAVSQFGLCSGGQAANLPQAADLRNRSGLVPMNTSKHKASRRGLFLAQRAWEAGRVNYEKAIPRQESAAVT